MSRWLLLVLTCLLAGRMQAQPLKPERLVNGSTITSLRNPAATIRLPKDAHDVGADRWILFGIADCEIHVLAEVNASRIVQRLYWVQFEGFLPEKPELTHTYRDPVKEVWGADFHVRTDFGPTGETPKAGSDLEHVYALIKAAGYTMPVAILNVRFVHLLDEKKRRELMIIYMEDASLTGVESWTDLLPGGKKAQDWPAMQAALLARARKAITVHITAGT